MRPNRTEPSQKVGEFRGGGVQKVFLQVNRGRGAVLEGIKTLTIVVLAIRSNNIQHGNQAEKRPERIEQQFPSRDLDCKRVKPETNR